jgi:hypothetical protein
MPPSLLTNVAETVTADLEAAPAALIITGIHSNVVKLISVRSAGRFVDIGRAGETAQSRVKVVKAERVCDESFVRLQRNRSVARCE